MVGKETIKENPRPPSKWADLGTRSASAFLLIFSEMFILGLGHWAIKIELLIIQILAFHEFLNLVYDKEMAKKVPISTRIVPWLLNIVISYHLSVVPIIKQYFKEATILKYHGLIMSIAIMVTLVLYVVGLTPENDAYCYKRLGYTSVGILITTYPISCYMKLSDFSTFWFFIQIFLVIGNDTAAYIFGRLFGKTQLIKLSPKKTVEGFVAGLLIIPIAGWFAPLAFANSPWLTLPHTAPYDIHNSQPMPPEFVAQKAIVFGREIEFLPAQLHCLILGAFASLVAPFGGFLASGFKRALGIKDFSNLIPGHGGIIDRFDCCFVMAVFAVNYIASFVRPSI